MKKKYEFNAISITEVVIMIICALIAYNIWMGAIDDMKYYNNIKSIISLYSKNQISSITKPLRDAQMLRGANDFLLSWQALKEMHDKHYDAALKIYQDILSSGDNINVSLGRITCRLYLYTNKIASIDLNTLERELLALIKRNEYLAEAYGLLGHIYYQKYLKLLENNNKEDAKVCLQKSLDSFQLMEKKIQDYHIYIERMDTNHDSIITAQEWIGKQDFSELDMNMDLQLDLTEIHAVNTPSTDACYALCIGRAQSEYARLTFLSENEDKTEPLENAVMYFLRAVEYKYPDKNLFGNIHVALGQLISLPNLSKEKREKYIAIATELEKKKSNLSSLSSVVTYLKDNWDMKKNQESYKYNNIVALLYLGNDRDLSQALSHKNENEALQATINYTNVQMQLKQMQDRFYQEKNNPKTTKSDEELLRAYYLDKNINLLEKYKELYDSIDVDMIQTTREFCILNNYKALSTLNAYFNGDSKSLSTLQKEWKSYLHILPDVEVQVEREDTKMTAEEITNDNLNILKKYRRLRKE